MRAAQQPAEKQPAAQQPAAEKAPGLLRWREITLDATGRQVFVSGREVALTRLAFELLLLFMKHPGRVFSRDDRLDLVWGYEFVGDEKGVHFHLRKGELRTGRG